MTQDDILAGFRQQALEMGNGQPEMRDQILALARLLADSRGSLSKEHYDTLMSIGAALYKEGLSRHRGLSDVNEIMRESMRSPDHD